MKRLTGRISVFMVLAMLVGLFSAAIPASAASAWSFKTKSGKKAEVNSTIQMEKNEYQDFNLYKYTKEITQKDSDYTVTWSSSDEEVVWINAKTGQARADKFGTMSEDSGEAKITATIVNKKTGAVAKRAFNVKVGEEESIVDHIAIEFTDGTDPAESLETGKIYSIKNVTYDKDGNALGFAKTGLYRKYFAEGLTIAGGKFAATKAGTYTITVAAYKSKAAMNASKSPADAYMTGSLEVVIGSVEEGPEINSIRQVSLNSVEITMNDAEYANKIIANNNLLVSGIVNSGVTITNPVKSIVMKEGSDKTLVVTMYSDFSEGVYYRFAYSGYENTVYKMISGSGTTPSYITLEGAECIVERDYVLSVKVYNSIGVDITDQNIRTVTYTAPETNFSYLSGSTLYFFNENQSVAVTATLDMGYDDNGIKIPDLTATAVFKSIAKPQAVQSGINGYAIAASYSNPADLTYASTVKSLAVGDSAIALFASFNYTDENGNLSTEYIYFGNDSLFGTGYSYQSGNESIVMVDHYNGLLYPVGTGSCNIIIKNGTGNVIGAVTVTVVAERTFTNYTVVPDKQQLSATGLQDDSIVVTLGAKDQLGENIEMSNVLIDYYLTYPANTEALFLFNITQEGNKLIIREGTGLQEAIANGQTQVYKLRIDATVGTKELYKVITFTVKDMTGVSESKTILEISKTDLDMKLNSTDVTDYDVTLRVKATDSAGYFMGYKDFNIVNSVAEASGVSGVYSVVIAKGTAASTLPVSKNEKIATISPVSLAGYEIVKGEAGTYTIKLYKGNGDNPQLMAQATLILRDTTSALSVEQKATTISTISSDALKSALVFKRGDTDITSSVSITGFAAPTYVNNRAYFTTITVKVNAKEMNAAWDASYFTEVDLTLNKLFTIGI